MVNYNNEYKELSRDDLIRRIKELEETNVQLQESMKDTERLRFPWIGNLGQWHWMVESNQVIFNEKKATNLGYDTTEIPDHVGHEFFTEKLHPEDYDSVMENMKNHLMNKTDAYEVEYRILAKNGKYHWYYDRGIVTKRDELGRPINVSGIVFDISDSKRLETELREANKKLHRMATIDELTEAYNRRYIVERIDDEIERCKRTNSEFTLVMFDFDHFKEINDECGHFVGDAVLKKSAKMVMENIRTVDALCRWGGDEFIILLPNTNERSATRLVKRLKNELENLSVKNLGNVTASFGVATYHDGDTLDQLIKRADQYMYKAKDNGGNSINIYKEQN